MVAAVRGLRLPFCARDEALTGLVVFGSTENWALGGGGVTKERLAPFCFQKRKAYGNLPVVVFFCVLHKLLDLNACGVSMPTAAARGE